MKLELELECEQEVERELEWELEWELELQPRKSREIRLDPLKIRILGQNGVLGSKPPLNVNKLRGFWATFQNRKSVTSLPAAKLYNSNFHCRFLIQNALSRRPMP